MTLALAKAAPAPAWESPPTPAAAPAPAWRAAPAVAPAPADPPALSPVAARRSARSLHAACAELLPGYAAATREPWRQALLTAGCLDGPARRRPRDEAAPIVVEDVVQPSDVLCALWLARRAGMFSPGSSCGDAVGLRSACEIIPAFAPGMRSEQRDAVLEALRANTAWRAHRAARALLAPAPAAAA